MPERSFGRTVRYRRTKLGLSQTQLADLVGRSTATIRSWERDQSRPNDPSVLSALAAILAIDERHLFDKAEVDRPAVEPSPTVEQALATLTTNDQSDREEPEVVIEPTPTTFEEEGDGSSMPDPEPSPLPVSVGDYTFDFEQELGDLDEEARRPAVPIAVGASRSPGFVAPPEPYQRVPLTPGLTDVSYIEDESQRQLYRVRNLATVIAVLILVIAFIWAVGEGLGALGDWWDSFFGGLRL